MELPLTVAMECMAAPVSRSAIANDDKIGETASRGGFGIGFGGETTKASKTVPKPHWLGTVQPHAKSPDVKQKG